MDLNIEPVEKPAANVKKVPSKAAQIRKMLRAGKDVSEIIEKLGVTRQAVYTVRWKMRERKRGSDRKARTVNKVRLRKSEVTLAEKLGVSLEAYAKQKIKIERTERSVELLKYELEDAKRQHNNWATIVAFLERRIQEVEEASA